MIQVRKVQPTDLTYIYQNADSLGYNSTLMSDKLENMMVVVKDAEICGIGFYQNVVDKCLLNWIHIKEENRRSRLGTMLVKTMLNAAEHRGAIQAYLTGDCDSFSDFLEFQKIDENDEFLLMDELYHSTYGFGAMSNIYKVSLLDYFKPCTSKKI